MTTKKSVINYFNQYMFVVDKMYFVVHNAPLHYLELFYSYYSESSSVLPPVNVVLITKV